MTTDKRRSPSAVLFRGPLPRQPITQVALLLASGGWSAPGWRVDSARVATVRYGDFEWDSRKASGNLRKHGVSFEEAASAFLDDLSIVLADRDHPERLVLIGMSLALRLLLVVHAEKGEGEIIRLISARRATRPERKWYEEES